MRCSNEYENSRSDDKSHPCSQAHHAQDNPESQLSGREDKPVNFGADKMRHIRLQLAKLLLEAVQCFGWRWLLLAGRRMCPCSICVHSSHFPVQGGVDRCTTGL